jgi:hypothetical protein
MKSFLDLIKFLYGPKAISSTVGTRTNVIRLPSGKLQKYLSKELNIEAASDAAAVNAYNEMKELIPEVAKMNDAERLIFEGNLRRLKNKLEDSGLIQKENVSSGITALESKVEQLKQKGKELEKVTGEKVTLTDVLNDLGASQQSMSRLYDEGLVRAAARQILINDIKAGKIKNITVSEAINMREPLDPFRQIYGEGALEQLDSLIPNLRGLKTEVEAEKLARSKFKFEPDENRLPGSVSIEEGRKAEQEFGINKPAKVSDFKAEATKRTSIDDLIDEYNANQDKLRLSDEEGGTAIGYEEFQKIQKRNQDIAKALEEKGISSKVEEAPQAEIIPFRKKPTEPEKKAKGGSVGLDYLMGIEPEDTTRENYGLGSGLKVVTKEPAAGFYTYTPSGDGFGLSSIIRAVPQPSAPSITLDAKPAVVRSEDDVVNRYRGYLNSTTPVQSDLEKNYKELINPSNPMLLTPATGLPVSIPTPVIEGTSFTSPQGEKIRFGGGAVGLIKPNGESYTGPVPENFNFFRYVAANGGAMGLDYLTGMEPSKGYADGGRIGFKIGGGKKILDLISKAKKPTKKFTDDEMIAYIKKYKEEGPTLEEFTKKINAETGSNFTPEQLEHAHRVKVAYPHSTPIVDSQGKFIGGGLYNPPLDVSISDKEALTESIMKTRKSKGLDVPKKYQKETIETPETLPKAGEGKFTKQQVLEKIIQKTIDANPTDEYVQKTFPNFIKEIRAKPELANNENVWKTFTQDFPENKRLVVYGDDTVDFFTKGENLPEGMKQTVDLADTYGISMQEARRIKQMEPTDQVMEIKKLEVLKNKTQKGMSLEDEMNMVLNQYDKSMFIKNDQGMVDVTNPENVQKMAILLKKDHPEIYKKLEEGMTQTNVLDDFDVTGRKPNANGGLNYLMGI